MLIELHRIEFDYLKSFYGNTIVTVLPISDTGEVNNMLISEMDSFDGYRWIKLSDIIYDRLLEDSIIVQLPRELHIINAVNI